MAAAVTAITQGFCILTGANKAFSAVSALGLLAIIAGFLFLVGFLTPITGFALTLGYVLNSITLFLTTDASKHANAFTALYLAVMSLAVALLGPGALSVDARLFGRLEIIIPDGRSR